MQRGVISGGSVCGRDTRYDMQEKSHAVSGVGVERGINDYRDCSVDTKLGGRPHVTLAVYGFVD